MPRNRATHRLDKSFFKRSALEVAEELLGKRLHRRVGDTTTISGIITETEAYHGYDDKACHTYKGKTPRNSVIFETVGYSYVYLCYGIHWLLNITTFQNDFPSAVLIRGVYDDKNKVHYKGPGKLTAFLRIDKSFNRLPVTGSNTILWVEDTGFVPAQIYTGPRVGVDYAQESKEWPWRFYWVPEK